ncbi:MAG TPA: DUF2269 family protein [Dokdonella sp.]|jgi:uncharacterized membrane protein|nr:DUF2269 family protein [Dokdonella sp.]
MITSYALYKLLHLVAVVLFLGNATLGLFWVAHAERTRDPAFVGHAMQGIIRADRWFTTPGVILITAAGIAAAMAGGYRILAVGWIAGSIGMFILSGLVFGFALAPLQKRIVVEAGNAADTEALAGSLRRWHAIGWVAVTPLWLAVAMMVLKWPG